MTAPALETRGLTKNFGAIRVADGIDFRLEPGARRALIGPNGAGKTSFVNLVTGRYRPTAGSIHLAGADVTAMSEAARARRGLCRTHQINTLFRGLSVIENVALAVRERQGIAHRLLASRASERAALEIAFDHLERLGLADDAGRIVGTLAYGRQRLVEIAVALALEPKVLLLDEPAAGVPSADTGLILDVVERLPADLAMLIIEHDMDLVFRLAREITVLVQGAVFVTGTPAEIACDAGVRRIYLGSEAP